jgi:hypothetical protein
MDKPLAVWDRIVYGAIAAVFGALLGLGACLCLFVVFHGNMPVRWIVLASAVYFYVVGFVRGSNAASLTGEALTVVGGAAMAEAGAYPGNLQNSNSPWSSWSSPVLLVAWGAMVCLIAWRA